MFYFNAALYNLKTHSFNSNEIALINKWRRAFFDRSIPGAQLSIYFSDFDKWPPGTINRKKPSRPSV